MVEDKPKSSGMQPYGVVNTLQYGVIKCLCDLLLSIN